ncbi:FAD-binding oxidoreductase [Methyloligella sp. 2.7D]|uniref:NAD(P)/FAD-dependent oxidoreductase n=1 Tax=unclassified Methyloligella TaxID=2625955 RepID=UPI00157DE214|nr:FAD-binding oxidoreductase [Methyloligella sp. GL2]QKP76040.1 FAD-binding oxidoreductase [Methyloligella sp. GL2]
MSPPVRSITSDETLPQSADLVIIGGGIVGCSAAYYAASRGLSVVVVEKGHVGGEQSSRNWGWVRQQGRAVAEMPLSRESLRLWGELQTKSEADLGFRHAGVLYVTEDQPDMERWERWQKKAAQHQIESRLLSATEAKAMTPGCTIPWIGGLYTENDGRAEPALAAPGIAEMARKAGAVIVQHCAARGLELEAGRVSAVVTEKGRIKTSRAIGAGGVWSALFCRRHGVEVPILGVRHTAAATTPAPEVTGGMIGTSPFTIRRRTDGGYTLSKRSPLLFELTPSAFRHFFAFWPAFLREGKSMKIRFGRAFFEALATPKTWPLDGPSPFEKESARVLDPAPDPQLLKLALDNLRKAYPALSKTELAMSWGGTIDATPDAIPVISAVDPIPGFFLAAGHSGHGFGTGPAAGHLAVDLATGVAPIVDPAPFRFSRMVDGSKLIPETGF